MLNALKQFIKIFLVKFVNLIMHLGWIFPVKNSQIYFSSHNKQYSCSPKCIYEYIKSLYGDEFFYIWVGDGKNNTGGSRTVFIKHKSIKDGYYLLTSKIIISNQGFPARIPFRKSQILFDTWHGMAYKKIGIRDSEKKKNYFLNFMVKKTGKRTDFILSPCKKFTDAISEALLIDSSKFLPYGLPRNDLFFSASLDKDFIKSKIGVDASTSILLYAPTYRGEPNQNNYRLSDAGLDLTAAVKTAEAKFKKKFILLYRAHHAMGNSDLNGDFIKNVTSYPDMQDLLYIADVMITDYSSTIWDFSFAFRPCFLFTPDLYDYIGERNFYFPISEWPFPFATTNEKLCENILNFNEDENVKRIKKHHDDLGSYEDGNATKKASEFLMNKINKTAVK